MSHATIQQRLHWKEIEHKRKMRAELAKKKVDFIVDSKKRAMDVRDIRSKLRD